MRGRWVSLSIPRRIISDLMYFSAGLPWIAVQRRLDLRAAAAAREAHPERPAWPAVFAKAFAIVAQEYAGLRRAYVKLPWPHLYEYETSAATIAVERDFGGEMGVAFVRIDNPASLPLGTISSVIRDARTPAYAQTRGYRKMARIAALPLLLRRALWWFAFNMPRYRGNYFGTFGLSTVASTGTAILQPRAPLTTVLTYDTIGSDGSVDVRAIFDHRALDAMELARIFTRLQEVMNGPIADELRGGGR